MRLSVNVALVLIVERLTASYSFSATAKCPEGACGTGVKDRWEKSSLLMRWLPMAILYARLRRGLAFCAKHAEGLSEGKL